MTSPHNTSAEYYRRHREAFLLALELGCTPKAAEQELRRRDKVRRAACGRRMQSETTSADIEPIAAPIHEFRDWSAPWMLRD